MRKRITSTLHVNKWLLFQCVRKTCTLKELCEFAPSGNTQRKNTGISNGLKLRHRLLDLLKVKSAGVGGSGVITAEKHANVQAFTMC